MTVWWVHFEGSSGVRAMRGLAPRGHFDAGTNYAAFTRFLRTLRTTRRFAEARFLAYAAARRSSSSNSRSFAEILRLLFFGWRDILASLTHFSEAVGG
jgi:hypothetical protein